MPGRIPGAGIVPLLDHQAIATVIGRRRIERDPDGQRLNLSGVSLPGVNWRGAHLERARLRRAHLEGANLYEAHLEGARLFGAHLEGAYLASAHLERALLDDAHLHETKGLPTELAPRSDGVADAGGPEGLRQGRS